MTNFTKFALAPSLALAALIPLATPAIAGSDDIVVTSQSEMDAWQKGATMRLNRVLARNPAERSATPGSGIVQVTFTLDEDGRPANIALHGSTAGRVAEQSAIYAVRRMGDLSDVPVANAKDAQFIANIVFANDRAERRDLFAELAQSEQTRLASGSSEAQFIALGG